MLDFFKVMEELEKDVEEGKIKGFLRFKELEAEAILKNISRQKKFDSNFLVFKLESKEGIADYDVKLPERGMKDGQIVLFSRRVNNCLTSLLKEEQQNSKLSFKERFEIARSCIGSDVQYKIEENEYFSTKTGENKIGQNLVSLKIVKRWLNLNPPEEETFKSKEEILPF